LNPVKTSLPSQSFPLQKQLQRSVIKAHGSSSLQMLELAEIPRKNKTNHMTKRAAGWIEKQTWFRLASQIKNM